MGIPAVVGGAAAIPGGDTAGQDALICGSVKVCDGGYNISYTLPDQLS